MQADSILTEDHKNKTVRKASQADAEKAAAKQGEKPEIHGEDLAHKFAMQFFGSEFVQYLGIRMKVMRIMPTELVHLDVKHMYEDFNFQMEDESWLHLEFESDSLGTDDLRRFRTYEAVTSQTYRVPVITYVLCSSKVKKPMNSITEGINTYRVRIIRLKDRSADTVFDELAKRDAGGIEKADLIPVVFTPLMEGISTSLERAKRGIRVLSGEYPHISETDLRRMQSAFMVLAEKFLTQAEMEKVKEEYAMSTFFRMLVDDGIQQGGNAMLRLVACMQKSDEDASQIGLLEHDPELRKKMMEKYNIII